MPSPLFVVNPASGGGFGARLLHRLAASAPGRTHRLGEVDLAALGAQARAEHAPVIACGGDGTVTALIEAVQPQGTADAPPIGIVPLGTGNDMARILGYPATAPSLAMADAIVARLATATSRTIDRWLVSGPCGPRAWFNYCSWGFDARIAWQFDCLRRRHTSILSSRLANLACYGAIGLQERGVDLGLLLPGGRPVPSWTRSLVLANIPSYAGGRRLGRFVRADDGRCDAFALGAGIAFGLGLSGFRRPLRLGVFDRLAVRVTRPGFMQLDGEPLVATPGEYAVSHGGRVQVLALG